jgi:WS/DGAT/MGAT family acyltransferase
MTVSRLSSDDLMLLVGDRSLPPLNVGAVLFLEADATLSVEHLVRDLNRRLAALPRLRQRLHPVPIGAGRPIWLEDTHFDIRRHVKAGTTPYRSESEVMAAAAKLLGDRLPRNRPLWSVLVIPRADLRAAAVVMVMHHVMADGMAGIALLQSLTARAPGATGQDFPSPPPSYRELVLDNLRGRLLTLARLRTSLRRLGQAVMALAPSARIRAVRTSLNRPTSARRVLATVEHPLPAVRAAAHHLGGTVNDVVLSAVTGALHGVLLRRGESADALVISIPFAARTTVSPGQLGNSSGVIPLLLPAAGDAADRIRQVAALTRKAKTVSRGASTALLGPVFRVLARTGVYQAFITNQRLVHTFVSNLAGPATPVHLGRCTVNRIVPLSTPTGNITVAFTALSYNGTLTVTIVADPVTCPDVELLCELLNREFAQILAPP